jgi:hypothetical protein
MLRKIAGWAIVIFAGFYLLSDPAGAAGAVHGALNGLHSAGTSLAAFVNSLGSHG